MHEPSAAPAASPAGVRSRWLHWLLFLIQATGALILFWETVPLYREALEDPAGYDARWHALTWTLLGIGLIQAAHWIRYWLRPMQPSFHSLLLGYVVLFAARLSFVLAGAVFGFVFIAQRPGFHLPVFRYVVIISGLFSLFCFTRELERLGDDLLPPVPPVAPGAIS